MPRRRFFDDEDVSLFPFLSVIACLIGVLTMMISTMALAQMDGEEIAVIEAWEKLQQQIDRTDSEIDRVSERLAEFQGPDGISLQETLQRQREELAALEAEQKQLQAQLQELQNVRIVIPEIDPSRRETVASLQAELDALQQELAQMERELEQRLQAAETTVSVLPAGSGVHLKPHFVECAKGAIVLHTQNPPKLIRAAEMVTDADFLNVLNTVAAGPEDMLVFLIRPDGLPVYRAAKTLCDELGIRSGRLPVPGDGRIDLTRFSRSRTVP